MIEPTYNFKIIEQQEQNNWQQQKSFQTNMDDYADKFYCLSMFIYPSGKIHMGHVRNYTIGDVITRYNIMLGKNVFQPMGFDAFGLPAENAAIKNNIPPAKWTHQNIEIIKEQFNALGFAYDWSKSVTTCTPEYYKWEQWLFIKMHEKGLVYQKETTVNWDPVDQTVLANEQVADGRGWRSGALVERKKISQWFFKITDYAEELLADLDKLDGWPEKVRIMQRNWIGKSTGVNIDFKVKDHDTTLNVYTTRADTAFGVTFVAIAAEHPLLNNLIKTNKEIADFVHKCAQNKIAEADMEQMEKAGIDTGLKALHPFTKEEVPIWLTNYVVMDYGSGAVMAVPAHDQRDYDFAKKYNIPITQVIKPKNNEEFDLTKSAFIEKGILINSTEFDGLSSEAATDAIAKALNKNNLGEKTTNYRLRDWSVSRQRYWGAPIPIVYCEKCGAIPVNEGDLPVILPENVEFKGVTSPLKTMPEFYETTCPKCGSKATRDTETFDTFVESSWYYARFPCADQKNSMFDARSINWLPVDQYIGGIEHACMHLLYARFIHKVLRDFKLVKNDEPFTKLLTQGMVLNDGSKMSKSQGNTVDPDEMIARFGADTVRLFMMFAAPPEQALEWSDSGIEGAYRFINRVWNYAHKNEDIIINCHTAINVSDKKQQEILRNVHLNLEQANNDLARNQFNTVISACMKIFNILAKECNEPATIKETYSILLRLLYPITPHFTTFLWKTLKYGDNISIAKWPQANANIIKTDNVTIAIQENGKLKGAINIAKTADKDEVINALKSDDKFAKIFSNAENIRKIIYVPNKILNIVK